MQIPTDPGLRTLAASPSDLRELGLEPGDLDAILVTGDAYVDHPSFGAAVIGRTLEARGFRVGVLARPDPDDVEAFRLLGRPKLAFLVTSGAVDSMVSNYTAAKRIRSGDAYAPGGDPRICLRADGSLGPGSMNRRNARPDRAVIAYTGMCRRAFRGVPVVVGGIEASLRRLSHYDYWSDTVRRSELLDSKADMLVYGMGETAVAEILRRIAQGIGDLSGIRGTVRVASTEETAGGTATEELPSFETVRGTDEASLRAFAGSFAIQYRNTDPHSARPLAERAGDRIVVQEPPAFPLSRHELDGIHELPYTRSWHPQYESSGGVPALAEVRFSLLSSRGCFGACSFCALSFHQGRTVVSRSRESLVREARILVATPGFKGYIHDVGGPTANFRQAPCPRSEREGVCPDRRCLAPLPCPALRVDHSDYRSVLGALRAIPGVKKVFIRSGIRFDYLMLDPDTSFLDELVRYHVSGQLKVAPEHVSGHVLELMGKPDHGVFVEFARAFGRANEAAGLDQYLVPYFISGHPGSGLAEAVELAGYLRDSHRAPEQVQDFYPTPGTLSTAMYRTGIDPTTGEAVHVPRGDRERALQRALLQYFKPENAPLVREALELAGRGDLVGDGPRCLVRDGSPGRRRKGVSPGRRPEGGAGAKAQPGGSSGQGRFAAPPPNSFRRDTSERDAASSRDDIPAPRGTRERPGTPRRDGASTPGGAAGGTGADSASAPESRRASSRRPPSRDRGNRGDRPG